MSKPVVRWAFGAGFATVGAWHERGRVALLVLLAGLALLAIALFNRGWPSPWSEAQREALRDLWIGSLPAIPIDPTNRFADDARAARLGARLFGDARLSGGGRIACASCHRPEHSFSDGLAVAKGASIGVRNTPSVVGAAYASAYFWDGRSDSQWAQALAPLENVVEMASTRSRVAQLIATHYRSAYEGAFGTTTDWALLAALPPASPLGTSSERGAWAQLSVQQRHAVNGVFANVGKALAAYQRTLAFEPSRFDRYVSHVLRNNHLVAHALFSEDERAGLELFIGRGNCTSCHRGALFTGNEFFSLGLPFGAAGADPGRAEAFAKLRADPFNCQGSYSDAAPADCVELLFLANDQLGFLANFKTPSLRNVAKTAPYMHAGQLPSLERVVDHYNRAPRVAFPEHTDIQPLNLTRQEQAQIVAFLATLSSNVHDPLSGERLSGP